MYIACGGFSERDLTSHITPGVKGISVNSCFQMKKSAIKDKHLDKDDRDVRGRSQLSMESGMSRTDGFIIDHEVNRYRSVFQSRHLRWVWKRRILVNDSKNRI